MGSQTCANYLVIDNLQKLLEKKFKKPSDYEFYIKVRAGL